MYQEKKTGNSSWYWGWIGIAILALFHPPSSAAGTGESPPSIRDSERDLLVLANRERARHRLPPLRLSDGLAGAAEAHSERMAKSGALRHRFSRQGSLSKRLSQMDIYFIRCGENIARSDSNRALPIHEGWMASPSHRDNILNPKYTHCGIQIVRGVRAFFTTQTFAQVISPKPGPEIEFILKERLESWWRSQFSRPFLYHSESQHFVRESARDKLRNRRSRGAPKQWGRHSHFTILYPDIDTIAKRLWAEMTKLELSAISVGAAMGRHNEFPGGTYAISAVLLGRYYVNTPGEELTRLLVLTLNRRGRAGPVFRQSERLSARARKKYRRRPTPERPKRHISGRYIEITFATVNPRIIPEEVLAWTKDRAGLKRDIGVNVRRSKASDPHSAQLGFTLILVKQ